MKLSLIHERKRKEILLVYHGTSARKGKKILNAGLVYSEFLITTPNADPGYVYVTSSSSSAVGYMEFSGGSEKALIVLEVNKRMLLPDEDAILKLWYDGRRSGKNPRQVKHEIFELIKGQNPKLADLVDPMLTQFFDQVEQDPNNIDRELLHSITRMLRNIDLNDNSYRIKAPVTFRGSAKVIGALFLLFLDKKHTIQQVGKVPNAQELSKQILELYGEEIYQPSENEPHRYGPSWLINR